MKKKYGILIIIITLIVIYITLKNDYNSIINLLFNSDVRWLLVGLFLVFGYIFFKAIMYYSIINFFKEYSFLKTLGLQFITFFFNAATPFSSGGQPFIVYQLKKEGIRINRGTTIVTQGTILNQIAVIIFIFIAILINKIYNIYPMTPILMTTLFIGIIVNSLVLIFGALISYNSVIGKAIIRFIIKVLYQLRIVKNKQERENKWFEAIESFNSSSKLLFKSKLYFIKLIILNILAYLSIYLVPLTILFSFHNYMAYDGIVSIVLTCFTGMIGSYVPLPGGSGGQEFAFSMLFSKYITNPLLGSTMLLWRFLTYYLPMLIGAIIFNINGGKKCE